VLEFADTTLRGDQFGLLGAGRARYLAGVDQFLFAPDVDGLVADAQVRGYLRDRTPSGDQIQDLTTELFGITPRHEQVSFDDFVTKSQANQLRKTGGTSVRDLPT
jgi:hypothetical protein